VVSPSSPNGTSPILGPSAGVAQASVCEAYAFGEAPTSAPSQNHTAFITMIVDADADIDSIYSQMGTTMRENIAPLLLNCVTQRRLTIRRQLQDNATELVNIKFTDPKENLEGKIRSYELYFVVVRLNYWLTFSNVSDLASCTQASGNGTCVPCMFDSEVYYFGEEPVGFDDKLIQALLFWQFDIPGLQSFEEVQVTQGDSAPEPDASTSPVPGPTDRGITPPTPVSAIETSQNSKNGPNPGAFVAVAAAALTLILVAVFVVRRRRDARSTDSQSKHVEFTDDFGGDVGGDVGEETGDDNSAHSPVPPPPRKSYIVGDQSLDDSWNSTGRRTLNQGQEVYSPPAPESITRRQLSETKFVVADVGLDPTLTDLPRRFYETDDTVNL
jgi:hypothetical protein